MKPRLLLFPLLLCAWASGFAQAGYTHVELQGGYELFPGMSNKSGVCLNLGGRYAFNERLFVAAMIHSGINNGSYKGMYAGEKTKLKHNMREYMMCCWATVSGRRRRLRKTAVRNLWTVLRRLCR